MVKTSVKHKEYRCTFPRCTTRFKSFTKSDLVRHTGTHLQSHLKPFHCTECDRHYVQKCGYERHIKEIHGHLEYPCQLCEKTFQKYDARRAHLKRDHGTIGKGKSSGSGDNVGGVASLSSSSASVASSVMGALSPVPSLSSGSESSALSDITPLWSGMPMSNDTIPHFHVDAAPPLLPGFYSSSIPYLTYDWRFFENYSTTPGFF